MPPIPPSYYETPACCATGHNFESRFTTRAPTPEQIRTAGVNDWTDNESAVALIEALTSKIYVCDVCVRCGATAGVLDNVVPTVVGVPLAEDPIAAGK